MEDRRDSVCMQHNEKRQELIRVISWSQRDAIREKVNECAGRGQWRGSNGGSR